MPELLSNLSVKIPTHHKLLLDEIVRDTENDPGVIVAQALAMLHAVHIGVWRIENNQLTSASARYMMRCGHCGARLAHDGAAAHVCEKGVDDETTPDRSVTSERPAPARQRAWLREIGKGPKQECDDSLHTLVSRQLAKQGIDLEQWCRENGVPFQQEES